MFYCLMKLIISVSEGEMEKSSEYLSIPTPDQIQFSSQIQLPW